MPGIEDLYREIILDHYRNPRNRGELPSPPALRAEGFNPLCGDEVVVYLEIDGDTVSDVKISGQGCSISQSSASMMSAAVKGKSVDVARSLIRAFKAMMSIHEARLDGEGPVDASGEATADPSGNGSGAAAAAGDGDRPGTEEPVSVADLGDLAALQGVVKFPVRIKCATLSWNTLAEGLDEGSAS